MKQFLLFAVSCLLSFNSFAETNESAVFETKLMEIQQSSNWEYLGDVQYYRFTNQSRGKGSLYVRIIGEKAFYQIRIVDFTNKIQSYNISLGDYTTRGKKYNAKFSAALFPDEAQDYYLNI